MQFVALLLGFAMSFATMIMHVTAISLAMPWVRSRADADARDPVRRLGATWIMSGGICGLLLLQLLSALAWTIVFLVVGLAPSFAEAGYLALTTISALGGDNAGVTSPWRVLLPLASINGALLFGLSTAVMFRLVTLFQLSEAPIKSEASADRSALNALSTN